MEKYGPDGDWPWKNAAGEFSPLGHHICEVCIPLRVDVDQLNKAVMSEPEDIALNRQVYTFVPPEREGRMAAGVTPKQQLLLALNDGDVEYVVKMLAEGVVPVDYVFGKQDGIYFDYNLLEMAATIPTCSPELFKTLELCGVPEVHYTRGSYLEAAAFAGNEALTKELLSRSPPEQRVLGAFKSVGPKSGQGGVNVAQAILASEYGSAIPTDAISELHESFKDAIGGTEGHKELFAEKVAETGFVAASMVELDAFVRDALKPEGWPPVSGEDHPAAVWDALEAAAAEGRPKQLAAGGGAQRDRGAAQ
eukprot:COSAG04_NODE_6226_length_1379_cov_2.010156_1_plen_307_part_00